MGRAFLAYGTPLTAVTSFRYFGQMLSSSNGDWPAVEQNLWRVRGKWGQLAKVLVREGADSRTVGRFYVVTVQVVLLFGYKRWIMTLRLEKSLKGFQHQAVQRMAGMGLKRQWDGKWMYTLIGEALEMVGMNKIGVYIAHRQNMVSRYIATCLIMDLCLAAERNLGLRLSMWCWEQPAQNILGIRVGHASAEGG